MSFYIQFPKKQVESYNSSKKKSNLYLFFNNFIYKNYIFFLFNSLLIKKGEKTKSFNLIWNFCYRLKLYCWSNYFFIWKLPVTPEFWDHGFINKLYSLKLKNQNNIFLNELENLTLNPKKYDFLNPLTLFDNYLRKYNFLFINFYRKVNFFILLFITRKDFKSLYLLFIHFQYKYCIVNNFNYFFNITKNNNSNQSFFYKNNNSNQSFFYKSMSFNYPHYETSQDEYLKSNVIYFVKKITNLGTDSKVNTVNNINYKKNDTQDCFFILKVYQDSNILSLFSDLIDYCAVNYSVLSKKTRSDDFIFLKNFKPDLRDILIKVYSLHFFMKLLKPSLGRGKDIFYEILNIFEPENNNFLNFVDKDLNFSYKAHTLVHYRW